MQTTSLRLPDYLFAALKARAEAQGENQTKLMRDLLEVGLRSETGRRAGPVETKVREDVEALVSTHPMGEAIAEMAFAFARCIDEGAGLGTAAVGRELRACLTELSRGEGGDDDGDFASSMPAALQYGQDED